MRKLWMVLETSDDRTLTLMRFVLGAVMFAHGAQKALGWFGGPGFGPAIEYFGQTLGIPAPLAVLAIGAEFLGGLLLMAGLLGRLSALGIAVIMLVAAWMVHWPHGFFMNWSGGKTGEGFEYHLLALALAVALVVRGSGAWSVDRWLVAKWGTRQTSSSGSGNVSVTVRPAAAGLPRLMQASWMWVTARYQRRL